MNQQLVTIRFAASKLEMLANRLWKCGEPQALDYVYGRIWLHSLELAHYFGRNSGEEYLRGLVGVKDSPGHNLPLPFNVSMVMSRDYKEDEFSPTELDGIISSSAENGVDLTLKIDEACIDISSNEIRDSKKKEGAISRRLFESEKIDAMEYFLRETKLTFSHPGSLAGDKIMSLIKVPLDRSAHDKNLSALYQSIQSDRVRLLWLDTSEDDKTLPGLPPLRSPALFYILPLEEHLRSLTGPMRRKKMKRWRISKSSWHSRSPYIEKAKQKLLRQRNYSLARWLKEHTSQHYSSGIRPLNPSPASLQRTSNRKTATTQSANVSGRSAAAEDMKRKFSIDLNPTRNSSSPVIQINGAKICSRGTQDKIKSSMSDAHLNKSTDLKSDSIEETTFEFKSEMEGTRDHKDSGVCSRGANSTSRNEHGFNRSDPVKTNNPLQSRLSTPANVPNFNSNFFSPKVQPMPCFLFYPSKPQSVVIQPSPWIVRAPARPLLARMMPTQMILPGYRPQQVSKPAVVRMQQCSTKCSNAAYAPAKNSVDYTSHVFHLARFQMPLKHPNGCLANHLTPPLMLSSLKADQGTQTDPESVPQKPFPMKPQKMPDLKVSLVHFPAHPLQTGLGYPVGMPHFKNFGMNCFPFVHLTQLGNNAV